MNILSTIRELFSPELLGQISKSVGESPEGTQAALEHAIPALLGSAAAKASSPEGATNLFSMLKEMAPRDGWPASAANLLGGLTGGTGGTGGGAGSGIGALLSTLLGSKANLVRDFIASKSGIRSESASSLLGIGGQLLMGVLGRQAATQGLGASSFGQLLRSQIPNLQGLLSPELASTMGIGGLLGAGKTAAQAAQAGFDAPPVAAQPRVPAAARGLPWAAVALAVLAGIIFLANRSKHQSNVGGASDENAAMHSAGAGMAHMSTSEFMARMKSAVVNSDGTPLDLQNVSFDSVGNLSPTAKNTMSMLADTIKQSPSVKLTITAYGKTTEEATSRATAIKSGLASLGVPEDRISLQTEVGDSFPKVSFTK